MHRAAFEVRGDEAREFGEAGAGHQCRLHQIAKRRLAGVDQASRLVNRQDAVAPSTPRNGLTRRPHAAVLDTFFSSNA
jgi:hypothetical protein